MGCGLLIGLRAVAGYSRIPYAAAQDGYFFKFFGRLHPKKNFPYVSLIVIGLISIACSFFSLGIVIDALITTRILIQFIGQIFAVMLLRKNKPDMPRPYRIWLYPIPSVIALIGWVFIFATSDLYIILFGWARSRSALPFSPWSRRTARWPFAEAPQLSPTESQEEQWPILQLLVVLR
jgi:amino acid transporter